MYVSTRSAQLFCTRYGPPCVPGQTDAIIGIGGWIGSGELWALPFETLSQTHCCISYDHRGSGASMAPVESITLDNLVDDLFAVMDGYGITRCVLAAESSGALTALSATLRHPDRISALVLVDAMVYRGLADGNDPFLAGMQQNYPATLSRFVDLCMPDDGPAHIKRWGRQINNQFDLRDRLKYIQQPALVLHCCGDKIVPVAQAHALLAALPNAKLVVFDDSGHIPTLTRPLEVAAQIERFLATQT
jgi:pimeloyl-ACP methyl ester carboxylesterase